MATRFPEGFLWGASTAAYQIEGGNRASDMWEWEAAKGWERSGAAAGSWERMEEDVRLLKELGANAYRFSIEWARVEPERGRVDAAALERYRRFCGLLAEAGIRPVVCLHHFTNPAWLHGLGGWESWEAAKAFLDHVRRIAQALSPNVDNWITFNEPNVYLLHAYATGFFPPGKRALFVPLTKNLAPALENMLRAHRAAYRLLHEARPGVRVGVAQHVAPVFPAAERESHQRAAEAWDRFFNWSFLDGAHLGAIDRDLDGQVETMLDGAGSTLDFVGVNYYTRVFVRRLPGALLPLNALPFFAELRHAVGPLLWGLLGGRLGPGPADELGHESWPEGLRQAVTHAYKRYGRPVWVTENGLADASGARRPGFLREHLKELQAAIDAGVPVEAYLHWSLIDNYEWGSFKPRFGLYRVDYQRDFRREPTEGAREYARIIREGVV